MAGQNNHKCSWFADQSGVAAVLFALCAAILVGLVALSVDVGHIGLVRTELQNGADACALAGARGFFPNTVASLGAQPPPDTTAAQSTANGWIGQNPADNHLLSDLSNVQTGIWDYTASTMGAWSLPIPFGSRKGPGITVTVKKQGALNNGPIHNALATIFGVPSSDAGAGATAALSGVGGFDKGSAPLPIAINMEQLADGKIIFFSPDNGDVGGWTGMLDTANTATIKNLINGALPADVPSGSEVSLLNGVDCALTKAIIDRYNLQKPANAANPEKGVYQPFNLSFFAPVITGIKFNQSAEIVGGVGFKLTEIRDSNATTNHCTLTIQIVSGGVASGTTGGGKYYGLLSLEPKLVQ